MTSNRSKLIAAAVVAALAVVIFIGLRLNDWGAQLATPSPSLTASAAIRPPSPTAGASATPTSARRPVRRSTTTTSVL